MIYDLKPLYNNIVKSVNVNEQISFDNDYLKDSGIKKLDNVIVKGTISRSITEEIMVNFQIIGEMILINSINLKDEEKSFNITINENIDQFIKIDDFSINILDIVWQYIFMEVPMKVVGSDTDEKLSGDGWQLLSEDEYNQKADPRLEKLKDLLKERS